jgi:hypothetical protein
VAGPSLNLTAGLTFDADSTRSPWWTLTAPVKLTGSLDVPDLKLHSGEIKIYDHEFQIAQAPAAASGAPSPSSAPPPASTPAPSPRHISWWSQTNDLECSLATQEDQADWFFASYGRDACGTFLVVAGDLYGPQTIPAGGNLGSYYAWTPVDQTFGGDGSAANPWTITTTVAAGSTGVQLVEQDTYSDGGTTIDSVFDVTGLAGDTSGVTLYQAADCYVAGDDYGTGAYDGANGAVTCIHDNGDGTAVGMQLTPLTSGASTTEELYSDLWADVASQGPLNGSCMCGTWLDNGLGESWALTLNGQTSVETKSRITLSTPTP